MDPVPDPGGQVITDPDSPRDFSGPLKKLCCQIGSISLNIIVVVESLSNSKDPDPGGQLITDPPDLDPQH